MVCRIVMVRAIWSELVIRKKAAPSLKFVNNYATPNTATAPMVKTWFTLLMALSVDPRAFDTQLVLENIVKPLSHSKHVLYSGPHREQLETAQKTLRSHVPA
jgi:hypothetical protein